MGPWRLWIFYLHLVLPQFCAVARVLAGRLCCEGYGSTYGADKRGIIWLQDLYGGQARIKPLREIFPLLESKYTLATKKELKPFLPYSHKLAALDFLVLLNSDVFMSNAAGNFPNVLVRAFDD